MQIYWSGARFPSLAFIEHCCVMFIRRDMTSFFMIVDEAAMRGRHVAAEIRGSASISPANLTVYRAWINIGTRATVTTP